MAKLLSKLAGIGVLSMAVLTGCKEKDGLTPRQRENQKQLDKIEQLGYTAAFEIDDKDIGYTSRKIGVLFQHADELITAVRKDFNRRGIQRGLEEAIKNLDLGDNSAASLIASRFSRMYGVGSAADTKTKHLRPAALNAWEKSFRLAAEQAKELAASGRDKKGFAPIMHYNGPQLAWSLEITDDDSLQKALAREENRGLKHPGIPVQQYQAGLMQKKANTR